VAHGGHSGSGVDASDGEVGTEGVTQGVDIHHATSLVELGDSGGLDVGVEYLDGRWVFDQLFVKRRVALVGQEAPQFGYYVRLEWDTCSFAALGVVGAERQVRRGGCVEMEVVGEASEFLAAQAGPGDQQVEQRALAALAIHPLPHALLHLRHGFAAVRADADSLQFQQRAAMGGIERAGDFVHRQGPSIR